MARLPDGNSRLEHGKECSSDFIIVILLHVTDHTSARFSKVKTYFAKAM